jgi:hypothetical protein
VGISRKCCFPHGCKLSDVQAAEALAAESKKPYCPVDDKYCKHMMKYIPDYQFVRSSPQDRECIVKNAQNEEWRFKFAEDCRGTLSPLNASCIVSQDLCQKMVSTHQQVLSEYQYEAFSTTENQCILKHKTNRQSYKVVISLDCKEAKLLPL